MKKETVIAISLGILLGGTIALVLIFSARGRETSEKEVITPPISPSLTQKVAHDEFAVSDPTNGFLTNKKIITLKGKAQNGALIMVQTQITEKALTVEDAAFSTELPLAFGENTIRITAYFNNNSVDKLLHVYRIDE